MSPIKRRRGGYPKEKLIEAINAVEEGKMSSIEASQTYKIPGSTIRSHISNSSLRIGAGRSRYLSDKEEGYLIDLLQWLDEMGVRLTKGVMIRIFGEYINMVTKDVRFENEPSLHWMKDFLARHKGKVKLVKEKKLERSRFTESVRVGWFSKLKDILVKNDLLYKPLQIFNMDESGFSDDTCCEWVCVSAERKYVYEENGGTGKSFTTIVAAGNAAGKVLPPYVIYGAQNVNQQWCQNGPIGAIYKCSNNGWINSHLFVDWLQNLFVVQTANLPKPILLIMDNLSSHISIESIELAQKHQIILLCLPPNCTHALQPLDLVTFGVVKRKWKQIVTNYIRKTKRKTIRKIDFPHMLNELYTNSFSPSSVSGGFRRAGVWPFDDTVMKEKVACGATINSSSTVNQSSATDLLSSLVQEVNSSGRNMNHHYSTTASTDTVADSLLNPKPRQRTFDDSDESEIESEDSTGEELPIYEKSQAAHLADSSSNNVVRLSSRANCTTPPSNVSLTSTLSSPRAAVRSIINTYQQTLNLSTQTAPSKTNSRLRIERQFGEDITSGTLLEELKRKAEAKQNQEQKSKKAKKLKKHPQRQESISL